MVHSVNMYGYASMADGYYDIFALHKHYYHVTININPRDISTFLWRLYTWKKSM